MATVDRERENMLGPAAAAAAASDATNGAAHDEEPEKPVGRTSRRRAAGQAASSKPNNVEELQGETQPAPEEAAALEEPQLPAEEPEASAAKPVVIVIEPPPAPAQPEPAVEEVPADEPGLAEPAVEDEPKAVEEAAQPADEEPMALVDEPARPVEEPEPPVEEPTAAESQPVVEEPQPAAEEARPLPPRPHPLLAEAPPLLEEPQRPARKKRFSKVTIIVMFFVSLLIMGISTVPAYYMSSRAEPIYGAQATIVFDATDQISQREIETEREVLGSRGVLDPVARSYGVPVDDLAKSVEINVQGETNALQLTVGNRDGESARKLAQAIAETYVQSVARSSAGSLEQAKAVLAQRIEELTAQLGDVQAQLAGFAGEQGNQTAVSVEEQQLQGEAEILLQRIGSLQDGLTNLELVRVSQAGARIVTPAYVLEKPLEPQPIRALALGCLIGLLIVAGMVLIRARLPE